MCDVGTGLEGVRKVPHIIRYSAKLVMFFLLIYTWFNVRFGHAMLPDVVVPKDENYKPVLPPFDINDIVFRFDLFA